MSLVYLKNEKSGRVYVYESENFYNPKTKKGCSKRKCIGHVDPKTGETVPNYKKGDKEKERLSRLPAVEVRELSAGIDMLLQKAVDNLKLEPVLKSVFSRDYLRILTVAFYLIAEHKAMCHVGSWQKRHLNPCGSEILSSQRISELFERITPSLINTFLKSWSKLSNEDDYYAMDVTSISSYSEDIPGVQSGYNRDEENLPQVNLLLIAGEETFKISYYDLYEGSINDVSKLRETVARLALLEFVKMILVFDKGFYCRENLLDLYDHHEKFVCGVPFKRSSWAVHLVEKYRETITDFENHISTKGEDLYGVMERRNYEGHRLYTFVYFDPEKAAKEMKKFDNLLEECREELLTNKKVKKHKEEYETYFKVRTRKNGEIKVELNKEAIEDYRKNRAGWFVLASNAIKDPKTTLEVYRKKDCVEKCFKVWKKCLGLDRLNVENEKTMEGKVFVGVIALMIYNELSQILKKVKTGKLKNYSLPKVLKEMETLHEIKGRGKQKRYYSERTKIQKEIFHAYDLEL